MPRKVETTPEGYVWACRFHTRVDDKGTRFRVGKCVQACHIWREAENARGPDRGLDSLIVKLWGYSNDNLMKADAKKAAELYEVSEEHAAGYIKLEKLQRGLR